MSFTIWWLIIISGIVSDYSQGVFLARIINENYRKLIISEEIKQQANN